MGKFRQEMCLFQAQLEARESGKIRKAEQVVPGEESLIRFSILQDFQQFLHLTDLSYNSYASQFSELGVEQMP